MPFAQVQPVIQLSVRGLCTKPYQGHPRGCPNWDKKDGCPPQARPLGEVMDLKRPIYVVWNRFNLGAHVDKMQIKHPKWSERQIYCCLYWQTAARKQLQWEISEALMDIIQFTDFGPGDDPLILTCPEACGVNVTATLELTGQRDVEWPPIRVAYQVALIGHKK